MGVAVAAGLSAGLAYVLGWVALGPPGRREVTAGIAVAKALVAATVAWHVMQRVAPGGGNPNIVATVATFSNQVLTPWESVALWSGLAVVAGELTRARGRWTGTALAAAAALLAVYAPAAAIVAGTAFAAAWLTERRWVIVAAGVAMVAFAWLAWVFDWRPGWGISNGPELTLWATVLAGAVVAGAGRPEAQGSQ